MNQRVLRGWQWVLAGAAAAVFVIAIVLSNLNPSLTYSSSEVDSEDGVVVKCRSSGEITDFPYLSSSGADLEYEVTSGEDELDRVRAEATDLAYDHEDPYAIERSINASCAAAETARLKSTMWVVALGLALVAAYAAVCVLRVVSGTRPDAAPPGPLPEPPDGDDAGEAGPVDADGTRNSPV